MKKFLALVLALVMTMSLVTISAGAEDFTDDSKITYSEAVDVMTAVGVVGGYADGSFNPTAGLTRGAAAKIICNMLLGPTTAEALVANEAPFADVAADNVFAGYIAYCVNEGIISGYADGTFRPAAPLTGYAFMKMLLGALGYDAAIEGYTGTNWSIAVAKRALNIGLDKGLEGDFAGAKALTREEACLYAFNAMKADMVKYDTKSTISVGDLTITQNSEAAVITDDNTDEDNIWAADNTLQFAEKFFEDLAVTTFVANGTTDAYGRPANAWSYDGDPVGTYAAKADFTYVNAYDKAAEKALDKANYVLNDTVTAVWYNGADNNHFDVADLKHGDNAITGYTIEMFNTDKDKNIEVVVVTEQYFAQVGKFTAANEKKGTDAKVVLTVTEAVAGDVAVTVVDDPDSDTDAYDKLAAYEKDDYVAVIMKQGWDADAANGADYVMAVADVEAVEGKLQKVTDNGYNYKSTVKMDGTTYKLNNECVGLIDVSGETDVAATTEGTLYLDAQGCVIGWVAKDEVVSDKAIAVTDVFNTLEDGKIVKKVEGVLSNGEKTVLQVASDASVNAYTLYTYSDVNEDGIYVLAQTFNNTLNDGDTYGPITTKLNKTDKSLLSNGSAYYAEDLKVIYVYNDGNAALNDDEVTVKEGMQDLERNINKYVTIEVDADGNKFVTAIFVIGAPASGVATADALVYVAEQTGTISVEIDGEDEDFYTYEAYVNGELVDDFYSKANGAAGSFYKNVVDEDTGAYILTGKVFSGDDDLGVVLDTTVSTYVANVVNGVYGVSTAVVNDLSDNFDGIERNCKVSMVYDKETYEALYVFVMDAPAV